MVQINFITAQGETVVAQGAEGQRLLELAQRVGMPLEGTCEGQMACSTCHVVIAAEWFGALAPASADEDDMLDLAAGISATSRLACQITLSRELDGMVVRIPDESRNMGRS